MPHFGPIATRDFVAALARAGFEGPFPRGKHRIMRKGAIAISVPNPHRGDIATNLLARLLRQAAISREEWERL